MQCKKYNIVNVVVLIGFILLFYWQSPLYGEAYPTGKAAAGAEWNIKKSEHFIVYYQGNPDEYISRVINKAEGYYRSITDYLGLRRFDFWTWDERCKIYLYPNREEYLKDPRSIPWSRGSVHIIEKKIVSYLGKDQFLDYVLPHELGHIVFRELVGFNKKLPLWMDEAVAVLQEKNRQRYLTAAGGLVKEGRYIPLEQLSDIRNYKQVSPLIFYSESASIMDFMLTEFGRDRFITFCRRLRDGEEWREALLRTYRFKDLGGLQEAWIDYVKR